jgi:hypothetical protein
MAALESAKGRGCRRIAFLGASDIAEIAAICALDAGLAVTAVVDEGVTALRFAGAPMVRSMDALVPPPDAVLVTDMQNAAAVARAAAAKFGADRVLVPALLSGQPDGPAGSA